MGKLATETKTDGVEDKGGESSKSTTAVTASQTLLQKLKQGADMIQQAVRDRDTRGIVGRVLRETNSVKEDLNISTLITLFKEQFPEDHPTLKALIDQLTMFEDSMEVDSNGAVAEKKTSVLPEIEMYAFLLTQLLLLSMNEIQAAKAVSDLASERLLLFNRRTLDIISARIYFYSSLVYEKMGQLAIIRPQLLSRLQTAILQQDEITQETLLNLLLRNYLHFNLYDQAEKLRSKIPEPKVSTPQVVRYLYYWGRIRAIQLEYTDAKDCLQHAARKAPNSAYGFRVMVNKWLVLVSLLLGDIPPMSDFLQKGMKEQLYPYFQVTKAVRNGDLAAFKSVAQKYAECFHADKTQNLITRLHHNVLRTGLRRINVAYSRISFKDIASKLGLESEADVEHVVAKAIRDGGIDATINHEGQYMESVEVADVYSTQEPQKAFHARIAFCLDIHNDVSTLMCVFMVVFRR
eukprot:g8688.t1